MRAQYPPSGHVTLRGLLLHALHSTENTLGDMKLKFSVLPLHFRQYKEYAPLLHVIVNNVLTLLVDILNIADIKVSNTTMDYCRLICKLIKCVYLFVLSV